MNGRSSSVGAPASPGLARTPPLIGLAAGSMLLGVALLIRHPYQGVWHDSVLYLGQALAQLYPATFKNDLFFAFGSQSDYTLLPAALGWLIQRYSAGDVFLWLTLGTQLLFLLASWHLVNRLFAPALRLPALLCVVALPTVYGGFGALAYAEPFLTARSFANPLVLLALSQLVSGRRTAAIALSLAALALHPLQALPGLTVGWLYVFVTEPGWRRRMVAATTVIGLSVIVLRPALITERMDELWYQQVRIRSVIVFYGNAGIGDWAYLLKDLVIAAVVIARAAGPMRHYFVAVVSATLILIPASLLLADLLHMAWPAKLQFWRVHWLLHWSSMAALPWLAVAFYKDDLPRIWPRVLVLVAAVVLGMLPTSSSPATLGVLILFLLWPVLEVRTPRWAMRALALFCAAVAVLFLVSQWRLYALWSDALALPAVRWPDPLPRHAVIVALLPFSLAGVYLWRQLDLAWRAGTGLLLAGALVHSGGNWDRRSDENRTFTRTNSWNPETAFGIQLARDVQVLWLHNLLPAWSVLQRPHYLDQQQLAGIVFNRMTSIEGFRRKELLHVQDAAGRSCRLVVPPEEPHTPCRPDLVALQRVCQRTKGSLRYVVLPYALDARAAGSWDPHGSGNASYYLYNCESLLSQRTFLKRANR